MATINFASNTYTGEVLNDLLFYTATENETYKEGLIHIKPGIQHKLVLPHISLGKIIQANKATPTSTEGAGSTGNNEYTFSERYLEPQDFMVYLEFNPRDFESYWKPFQPTGELIFRELPQEVQAQMLRLLIDRKDQYINDAIWGGDKGGTNPSVSVPGGSQPLGGDSAAGPMSFFDGALARVLDNVSSSASAAEKASGKAVISGTTTLDTGEKVKDALVAMWKKCPNKLRKSKNLKFVMNFDLWNLYDDFMSSQDFKNTDYSLENKRFFKGKEIVVINGVPDHTIFLGKFSSDQDSCLWAAVDYATDQESVKVERLLPNSEMYFFQMRMKMDVNIVLPSEVIVHTAYTIA